MSEWTDGFFGRLYGEIYGEYLLAPERAVEEAAFASHVLDLGRRTVLDIAAGFGRHARLLARSNKVIAIDRNADYLRAAHADLKPAVAKNLLTMQADMRRIPLTAASADAALLLFNSFGYFSGTAPNPETATDNIPKRQIWKLPQVFYDRELVNSDFGKFQANQTANPEGTGKQNKTIPVMESESQSQNGDENQMVLGEISRCLKPGGGFLMELPNPKMLLEAVAETPRRVMVAEDFEVHEQFVWQESERTLSNVTIFKSDGREESAGYRLRLYTPEELSEMLDLAGFRIIRKFGNYEGEKFYRSDSDSLIVLAKKRSR